VYHHKIPNLYHARVQSSEAGVDTVEIGFGDCPATNDELVPAATAALASLSLGGGEGIRFTGPASLPVAMALAHQVAHLYGYVACWDPKLSAFVVAISHHPRYRSGQRLA
jgi:CRISPR-associated protein Csx3